MLCCIVLHYDALERPSVVHVSNVESVDVFLKIWYQFWHHTEVLITDGIWKIMNFNAIQYEWIAEWRLFVAITVMSKGWTEYCNIVSALHEFFAYVVNDTHHAAARFHGSGGKDTDDLEYIHDSSSLVMLLFRLMVRTPRLYGAELTIVIEVMPLLSIFYRWACFTLHATSYNSRRACPIGR